MPISSSLSARLGAGPAPAPARWSPYARPTGPRRGGGGSGCAKACRSPLRLEPATARLLGPVRKEAASRSSCRAEAAASAVAAPTRRWGGEEKLNQERNPKPVEEDKEPPVEESRGAGGFAFLCTLAGHTQAISGISMPMGSDKLYSGSADGSVRVWDCNSGKCIDIIKMGGKVGCMITHDVWVFVGIPKSVEAWNTQTGMKLSLEGPSGLVCSMTIKDEMLFAGTGDGHIMAWKFPAKESDLEPVAILSGHERHVISLSVSATRLYSGSLDKTIKGLRTLFGMHRVGKMPVLFCSLHNINSIRLFDLPSPLSVGLWPFRFTEMGKLSSKKEVKTIELSAGGLLFTGDGAGELKVWRWTPQDEESRTPAPA